MQWVLNPILEGRPLPASEMVALLPGSGFSVNAAGKHFGDGSPLLGAVFSGSPETVQLLVAAGADPHRSQMLESDQVVDAAEFAGLNGRQSITGFCGP